MPNSTGAWRRGAGLFCLLAAVVLLVCGLTVLKPRLHGVWFLLYWFSCFFFTFAAMVIAVVDVWAVRRQGLEAQRELYDQTLADLEADPERKPEDPRRPPRRSEEPPVG